MHWSRKEANGTASDSRSNQLAGCEFEFCASMLRPGENCAWWPARSVTCSAACFHHPAIVYTQVLLLDKHSF